MFKSLFCLGFIFQYEVLLIYSSLISLPYHVGLLGLIYDPTVSYNLHGFAGLFHPLDILLLYQQHSLPVSQKSMSLLRQHVPQSSELLLPDEL